MAAVYSRRQLGLRDISVLATVPADNKARLMYYLDCICSLLNLSHEFPNQDRLRDYEHYYRLTEDETKELIVLCGLLKPDLLLNKCIFQDEAMCRDSVCKFFKLEEVSDRMLLTDQILIGGRRRKVFKIMFFKPAWLQRNYLTPMMHFVRGLVEPTETTPIYNDTSSDDNCSCCSIM